MTCENPKDKRNKLLRLSPAGRQFASEILEPLEAMEVIALSSFSKEEREQFIQLTQRYTNQLKKLMQENERKTDD